jgi:hypothetical protein
MRAIRVGEKFGHLSFFGLLPPSGYGKHRLGIWKCDCGNSVNAPNSRVVTGYREHCGCLSAQRNRDSHTKHGGRYTREYSTWKAMRERCHKPESKDYPRYGARGITVCEEWRDSFEAFLRDMGPRPQDTTLDRVDGTRGYEPGNCRWATVMIQARNRRDFTVINSPVGTMPLVDYASLIGISRGAAHLRLRRGKLEGCARV